MNNSRMTRKFERLLFSGVPEQPETVYERNDNSYVVMRQTGRSQNAKSESISKDSQIVGVFTFDHSNQTETYESKIDKQEDDQSNHDAANVK